VNDVAKARDLRDWIADHLDPLSDAAVAGATRSSDFDLNPGMAAPEQPLTPAAVLVGLVEREAGYNVLLTRRSDTLRSHTGQVAFPGGRQDPGERPWETALREAHEEIGLEARYVTLAGLSTPHRTGTGFLITPVVGFVRPGFALAANPHEVADIFETPFHFLMDPANHEQHEREMPTGERRRFYAMTHDERFIWGATAGILRSLYERLYGAALGEGAGPPGGTLPAPLRRLVPLGGLGAADWPPRRLRALDLAVRRCDAAGGRLIDGDGDLPYGQSRRDLRAGGNPAGRQRPRGPLRTEMTDSLGRPSWMTLPETAAVMDALEAAGGADCARFVGGCVRNTLIGAPVDDLDIATTLTPDAVTAALQTAGLRAVPTGIDHGTVTAVSNHRPYEITTLRRDVATDGRRAVVAFTTDWLEDAQRRDFTLNALYAGRDGAIFDPTGHGVADAKAGRIVFVGEPEQRLAEDYLRILRFFRFYAWYGRGAPDAAAVAACAAMKANLASLAAERISKELLKLLAAEDPRAAVRLMAETSVLSEILPSPPDIPRFEGLVEIETELLFEADPTLRLAALLPDDQIAAAKLAETLRLSNDQRDRICAALAPAPKLKSWMSPREIRREVYRVGAPVFRDRAKLAWATAPSTAAAAQWRGMIALAEGWTPPAFPLTGDDVMKAGVPKGPLVGQVLREVEDWWIDQDFLDDKLSAVEKLKAVAQGLAY
jgi:poly(A) polymerase